MSQKLRVVKLKANPARRRKVHRRYRRNRGTGAEPSFNIRMAQTRRGADHYNRLTKVRAYDDPLDALDDAPAAGRSSGEFPGDRIARERRQRAKARRRHKVVRRRKARAPAARKQGPKCRAASRWVVQVFERSGSRLFPVHYLKGSKLVPRHATPETFATATAAHAAAKRFMKGAPAKYPAAQVIKA